MPEQEYGRRKDDLAMTGLPPEIMKNLTDSQKINVEILTNLTSLNTAVNDIRHDVMVHDKILVTGNGTPSLQERLRTVESYIDGLRYWGRFLGGAIIIQSVAFFVGIVIAIVRFLPLLEKIAAQP